MCVFSLCLKNVCISAIANRISCVSLCIGGLRDVDAYRFDMYIYYIQFETQATVFFHACTANAYGIGHSVRMTRAKTQQRWQQLQTPSRFPNALFKLTTFFVFATIWRIFCCCCFFSFSLFGFSAVKSCRSLVYLSLSSHSELLRKWIA